MKHPLSAPLAASLWCRLQTMCHEVRGLPEPGSSVQAVRLLHRHPARFQPSAWFSLLPGLHMEHGWELDYVFQCDGNHGHPILYARRIGTQRADTPADLPHAGVCGDDWQCRVRVGDTPEACLQMVMLSMVAPRFHLVWHSQAGWPDLMFDEARLRERLNAISEPPVGGFPPPGALDRPRSAILDAARPFFAPTVLFSAADALVHVLTWVLPGGLSRRAYRVSRGHPVRIVEETWLGRTLGGLPT